ncbi:cyclic-phosphate processing receiver domain-containing protein [Chryseobacterium balustinum]|uniref:Cyclic-phosphate processing Receiver domain-containing protein n=1 Tax=Chryseobacterium balustinum TaxID=246 RepID=A0ABY1LBW9_9FLAO|nr:cyclic-phosphate processing receiver domain-containing protein [Chryseobacterium balustinum]AZB32132.1 hypothetical protein EB354_22900 [Chryseobacterium balustinum]SKB93908.1 hypothetical protein SAMN05421800_11550 [Chryseobacterium balustinum]
MVNLYLDDVRACPKNFLLVTSYDEFVNFIRHRGFPNFISFDHDLGLGKTGYDCAKFLVEYCLEKQLDLPCFFVHSQNPVGKLNIESLLKNFQKFQKKEK